MENNEADKKKLLMLWHGLLNNNRQKLKNAIKFITERLLKTGKKERKKNGEGYKPSPKEIVDDLA